MTSSTTERILPDEQWLTLLRSGQGSEFSTIDRRHAVHGLVAATVVLATADAAGEVPVRYAATWLEELAKAETGAGFVLGPVVRKVRARCLAILPGTGAGPRPPRPVLTPAELAVPLSDVEWLALLSHDETWSAPRVLVAYSYLLTAGPVTGPEEVRRLWFAVSDALLDDPTWRPGPLVSRIIAQVPPETAEALRGGGTLDDLRGLAGVVPSDDPTGPWTS